MPDNLTQAEAARRAELLAVESYRVTLDLAAAEPATGESRFGSRTVVRFRCAQPGACSFIDLTAPSVSEITLNGQPVSLDAFDGHRITLSGLAADNELHVVADCAYSRDGEGLHRFTDPADGGDFIYSDLETFLAHKIYACFDQPDLKATFAFTVIGKQDWQVISNMAAAGPPEPAGQGLLRWRFPPTPVLSSYLTAIVAGHYHSVRSEHDGIQLGIFCRKSLASYLDPDEIFDVTRQGLDFFHQLFGIRYSFGKYDQVFVPEFNSGAMENAGCVTFTDRYIFRSRVTDTRREARADTILHEMAHMWFGDLVTMRWWDDLWLNESFATWAAATAQSEATRWPGAWTTFASVSKALASRQDQLPSTHPVAADIPDIAAVDVNFDSITYEKGSAVLRQLVAYTGQDAFIAGLRKYFAAHSFGNATLADLLTALTASSGRELTDWSRRWLESAGVNTFRPQFEAAPDGTFTSFAVLQEAPADHPVLRPHRIAIGLYGRTAAGLVRWHRTELDVAGPVTEVPDLVGLRQPDLVLLNDDDLSYAKIRFDHRSLATLTAAGGAFAEPLPAAICWAAAWDMCRDAELPARDFVRMVLTGLSGLTSITVLQNVLGQAATAARSYADPAWRPAGLAMLAAAFREQLSAAVPGSDRQLALAQAFAEVAASEPDLAMLAGLLDGSVILDGLHLDTDLRWLLLQRLVSRGAAADTQIETELSQDRTDAGERRAAACRAAIPDAARKAETWGQIMAGLPNATFRAVAAGFYDPDQDELLVPYAEKYFAAVDQVWRDWSPDLARHFAMDAYPVSVVSAQALAAAHEFIASAGSPPALRRLVSEGADEVARSLRARNCDAAADGGD